MLSRYRDRDAVGEATQAAHLRSPKLMGVLGFSLSTPGIPGSPYCWKDAGYVEIVEGTGDALCNAEDEALQRLTRKFAADFNGTLFSLNAALSSHRCATEK
jgi:hypothetical protein